MALYRSDEPDIGAIKWLIKELKPLLVVGLNNLMHISHSSIELFAHFTIKYIIKVSVTIWPYLDPKLLSLVP